ncbi:MAG: MurR/RpiR family transcriptional regulator [Desulfobacterales bacterium]|nr:MAG: MurR/RpiR family transcriptional regulator [Desulfobacterales bacterium]
MSSARKDLFEKIIKVYPMLSPKKRRVADLIIKDHKKIFLMTAKEIAQECNVSEPTIIRFVNDLGFSGYVEFVQYMKGLLHIELTAVDRLRKASQQADELNTLDKYCQNAIQNIENLRAAVSEKELKQVAKNIFKAETVYVVGYRASAALAYYFGYLLKKIRNNVFLDTTLSWEIRDLIVRNGKSGVMVVIAFPRYPRKTIDLMLLAKKYNVKIIGLSDTPKSPIITLSDKYVIIDLESVSFIDPFAHVMAYLGALIHEITFLDNDKAIRYLSKFDDGVKVSGEFYADDSVDGKTDDKLNGSYLASFWPQAE